MSFFFGVIFFIVFYIQKLKAPVYYFSFGELIYGIKTSIRLKAFLLRFTIIFIYGFLVSLIFSNVSITILSSFWGSFMIIWPGILNPYKVDSRLKDKTKLVILFYMLFIMSSALISFLGFLTFSYIRPLAKEYADSFFVKNRFVLLLGDFIFSAVVMWIIKLLLRLFDKEIKLMSHWKDE